MTPEERRALVEAPLPAVRIHGASYAWCGRMVDDDEHQTLLHGPHPRDTRIGMHGLRTIDIDEF